MNSIQRQDKLTLFLAGDVMTGRGVDQIMPHPGVPHLFEGYAQSALDYVKLAEQVAGPIARRADFSYIWGAALANVPPLPHTKACEQPNTAPPGRLVDARHIPYRCVRGR